MTIDPLTHRVTFLAPANFKGYEDITFTVSSPDGKVNTSDTLRILVDSPPKLISGAFPDTLRVHEDSLEAVLYLPKIVEDADDVFSKLRWFFTAEGRKVRASTASDSLFLKGILNFSGNERLWISVYDSYGVGDSLTVPVWVIPVNDRPELKKLPDLTMERNTGSILDLGGYASDADSDPLTVSWKEPSHFQLTKSGMRVNVSGAPGFLGSERLYFTVTDPGGLSASDSLLATVTTAKKAPVWSKIPKIGFAQNHADSSLALWNYVADPDDPDSLLTFVFANLDNVDSVYVNTRTGRTTFYDRDNAAGWDRVTVTAYDPDGNHATVQFPVFIGPSDGTPIVAGIPDTTIVAGAQATWIDLDDYYYDVDNTDSQMRWAWGREAGADSSVTVSINSSTHVVILRGLSPEKYGLNRIFFTVTDPGGKFGDDICLVSTIAQNRPVLDLPSKIGFVAGTKAILDLDEYVYDSAYLKNELTWSWSGNHSSIIALESPESAGKVAGPEGSSYGSGNRGKTVLSRPVSFTGPSSWIGWEPVAFEVRNPLGGAAKDTLRVYSVSDDGSPLAGGLEHVTLKAGQSVEVSLDSYYFDYDHADFQMTWSVSGGDSVVVGIDALSHIATISAPSESWEGQNTITFKVTDPDGHSASMPTVVTVTDAVLRNAFSVSILRNPMQEDYMDLYILSASELLTTPTVRVLAADDSTRVTLEAVDSKFYHGRYLLPLNLSLGTKGTAEIATTGKTTAGKSVSGAKQFGYGRLGASGGKIVCGKLSLDVPGGALSKPEFITLIPGDTDISASKAVSGEVDLTGETCLVGPASLKTVEPLALGIAIRDGKGAGIYRLTGEGPVYAGGEHRNGTVTAFISGGGSYRLGYDRIPPRFLRTNAENDKMTIVLSDDGSGIDRGSIWVERNGAKLPWRFDEARSAVIVNLAGLGDAGALEISFADRAGNAVRETVSLDGAVHPQPLLVEQNSPNPFNPTTDISFTLGEGNAVTVEVFDLVGRRIAVLADRGFSAGRHTVTWNARDDRDREVSSGVYFYRVTANGQAVSRKMLFLR